MYIGMNQNLENSMHIHRIVKISLRFMGNFMARWITMIIVYVHGFIFSQQLHYPHQISFPDVGEYLTLVCDLHTHSVFSDGSVWPDIRVMEAQREGVDAIAITEHLEYQMYLDDIPHPDRNRAFILAEEFSKDDDVIIINGAEITRDMPPGHCNAIFVQDANMLLDSNYMHVFKETKNQRTFNFWNHPHWVGQESSGTAILTEVHKMLIQGGYLSGIEVANELSYSEEALQIALEHNLTILGTSDIHTITDWKFAIPQGGHRTVTLVFAKEKSITGIKEALLEKRTVAWYDNLLIGREEWISRILSASLTIVQAGYYEDYNLAAVTIRNNSDARFVLFNKSEFDFYDSSSLVEVPAHGEIQIAVKTIKKLPSFELRFEAMNTITAPDTHGNISFTIEGADQVSIKSDDL